MRHLTGDYPGAAEALEAALRIYRDLGNRVREAEALSNMGRCTGSAVTWTGLGRVTGRPGSWPARSAAPGMRPRRWPAWAAAPWPLTAEAGLRQAQEIFQRIDAAEAAGVAAELAALTGAGPPRGKD